MNDHMTSSFSNKVTQKRLERGQADDPAAPPLCIDPPAEKACLPFPLELTSKEAPVLFLLSMNRSAAGVIHVTWGDAYLCECWTIAHTEPTVSLAGGPQLVPLTLRAARLVR
ncbi:hypothetical protein SKAU_G00382850 [Synaphobranchus kaupii]|uniref:Uncharacterized protein n=1 Tax=Synaphobranchus kaupii TaxID=118154 RepID=A0A9Q1IE05_SYNKA|nr:hypothetical protein SKAU_G00382850 [Synaphobranchus kaupii]